MYYVQYLRSYAKFLWKNSETSKYSHQGLLRSERCLPEKGTCTDLNGNGSCPSRQNMVTAKSKGSVHSDDEKEKVNGNVSNVTIQGRKYNYPDGGVNPNRPNCPEYVRNLGHGGVRCICPPKAAKPSVGVNSAVENNVAYLWNRMAFTFSRCVSTLRFYNVYQQPEPNALISEIAIAIAASHRIASVKIMWLDVRFHARVHT